MTVRSWFVYPKKYVLDVLVLAAILVVTIWSL